MVQHDGKRFLSLWGNKTETVAAVGVQAAEGDWSDINEPEAE